MLSRHHATLRNAFATFLLLGTSACAAAPASTPRLDADVPGIERLAVRPAGEALRLEGTARCEWPATPSRTALVLVALDAGGRELTRVPVEASALPATGRHKRNQRLRLTAELPATDGVAQLVVARP